MSPRLALMFPVALTIAVHATGLFVPFIAWDDPYYVTDSERTARPGLDGFLNLWTLDDVTRGASLEFFPLRDVVYWGLFQAFGKSAFAFHCANLFFHALAVLALGALARRLRVTQGVALWGCLLFAAHPIHVESVAWVSALKDPMFASAAFASLLAFAAYRETKKPWHYAMALFFLLGSLLVKGTALGVPWVMLAMDRTRAPNVPWSTTLRRVSGPFVIAGLFIVQMVSVSRYAGAITPPHGGSWRQHAFLGAWAFVRYVQQAFVPATFRLHYCFERLESALDARLVIIVLGAMAGAFSLWRFRKGSFVVLGATAFVAFLLPVMNFVPHPTVMNDRYLYASSAVAAFALAALLLSLPGAVGQRALVAAVAIFGATTAWRGVFWQDPHNLWTEAAQQTACLKDDSEVTAAMYLNHGFGSADVDVALTSFARAMECPGYAHLPLPTQCSQYRAVIDFSMKAQRWDESRAFAKAATQACGHVADLWLSRAEVLLPVDAIGAKAAAESAMRLKPDVRALWLRGQAKVSLGDVSGRDDVVRALRSKPKRLCGHYVAWRASVGNSEPEAWAETDALCRGPSSREF